jgi:hypothetical protein
MEKIRQLFKENHIYTRNTIIKLINNVKPYPLEQIYSTLTYLVDNKNEMILDKYGRKGILKNKNNIYMFQPIKITDLPIEYTRNNTIMKVPKNNKTYQDLITDLNSNLKIVFEKDYAESLVGIDDNNYYKRGSQLVGRLHSVHGISITSLRDFFIYHYLDTSSLDNKLMFAQHVFKITMISSDDKAIKRYFNNNIVEILNINFILLGNTFDNFLYRMSDWTINNGNEDKLEKFRSTKLNESYIGYYTNDGISLEPVLKMKKVSVRSSKGFRIGQSGKEIVLNILNTVTYELSKMKIPYNEIVPYSDKNTGRIQISDLVIIVEMIMREMNVVSDKNTFLTPEEVKYIVKN